MFQFAIENSKFKAIMITRAHDFIAHKPYLSRMFSLVIEKTEVALVPRTLCHVSLKAAQ